MGNSTSVMAWRNKAKIKLIEYKGGKCIICGYDKTQYPRAFVFHHENPNNKDFSIGGKSYAFERLQQEVDKCVLMCSRCHNELHDTLINQQRQDRLLLQRKYLSVIKCPKCSKEFKPITSKTKYCSVQCAVKCIRKIKNAPTKEELEQMLHEGSNVSIAKIYDISEAAVRKWRKKYGL